MNKSIFIILIGYFLSIKFTVAQTTTINYLTSGLNPSSCNVFDPSAIINGVNHTSRAGGVKFNSSYGLGLTTTPRNLQPGATAFIINYNFTPGYNYTISITAKGNSALYLKTCVVPNLNQFSTNGLSACSPDPNAYTYNTVGIGQFSSNTTTTPTTYNIQQFSVPAGNIYPHLVIWASGGQSNLYLDELLISNIIINKTPSVSFKLLPSTITISCGSSDSQTFTVNNEYSTPNVTNHLWNLGADNGWLYNGNPAPQTISTGNSNSLSLIPVCNKLKKDISVIVTAGSNNYQSNTASIINSSPSLNINGNSAFCSGSEVYSISNLPCNSSVSWSTSNSGIATINPSGSSTILTKTGNGDVVITATISGVNCLNSNLISKTVSVGTPTASNITIWNSKTSTTINNPVGFVAGYPPNNRCDILGTQWQSSLQYYESSGDFTCISDNNTSKNIFFDVTGTAYVQAKVQNNCGWSDWSAAVPIEVTEGYYLYTIYPNPLTSLTTISAKNGSGNIVRVKVYDKNASIKKEFKYPIPNKSAKIDLSELKDGIYILEISDGKKIERQQLIKK